MSRVIRYWNDRQLIDDKNVTMRLDSILKGLERLMNSRELSLMESSDARELETINERIKEIQQKYKR